MDRSIAETLGLSEVGVILVLVVIAIALAVITRVVTAKRKQAEQAHSARPAQPVPEPAPAQPAASGAPSVAQCRLTNCDDATAALIIAIVADSLGEEFNGMQVTSIKQI